MVYGRGFDSRRLHHTPVHRVCAGRTARTGSCRNPFEEIDMNSASFNSCITACNDGAVACDRCAAECLTESDVAKMARCIQLDMDCAQICRLAVSYMCRGSEFAADLCDVCADICEACAQECAKHPMGHCQDCAKACRRCAEECRRMTSEQMRKQSGQRPAVSAH